VTLFKSAPASCAASACSRYFVRVHARPAFKSQGLVAPRLGRKTCVSRSGIRKVRLDLRCRDEERWRAKGIGWERCLRGSVGASPSEGKEAGVTMNVSHLMTREPATCRPEDDLSAAAALMWDRDIGCLPVIGADGRAVGMITDRDICMAAYTQGKPLHGIKVSSVMSHEVFACLENDSIVFAEETMRLRKVRRLPVLDDHGHLVGVLSLSDLALEEQREQGRTTREVRPEEIAATLASISEHRRARVVGAAA
jgi:CBS domain-containing protein